MTYTPYVAVYQGKPKQEFEAGMKAEAMEKQYLFLGLLNLFLRHLRGSEVPLLRCVAPPTMGWAFTKQQ